MNAKQIPLKLSLVAVTFSWLIASPLLSPSAYGQNSSGDPQKWKQDFDLKGFLNKLDKNKNGIVEPTEASGRRSRYFLANMGVDVDSPIPINETAERIKKKNIKKRENDRKEFEEKVRPKLNGFGAEPDSFGVAHFGVDKSEPNIASFTERLTGLKPSDFDQAVMQEAQELISTYDLDKSGYLEGDEIKRVRWGNPPPAQSDLNNDGRISLLEMAQRKQTRKVIEAKEKKPGDDRKQYQLQEKRAREISSQYQSKSKSSSRDIYGRSGRPPTISRDDEAKPTAPKSKYDSYRNYVDGIVKRYDADKDGQLSQGELSKMRRPFKGDTDEDGFITKSEAIEHLLAQDKSKSGSQPAKPSKSPTSVKLAPSSKTSGRSSLKSSSKSAASDGREPFSDRDTNEDGQIQMSEFSSQWNEETLQDFRKSDTNEDGILSAEEWKNKPK